jgi:copper oxidase (laccase) domain-containing protein
MDMKFGTWTVRNLYRVGAVMAAARELARYKLDSLGVQKVRWNKEGTVRTRDYNFVYRKRNENYHLEAGFLYNTE